MKTTYRPRSIAGAQRRVRELQSQLEYAERMYQYALAERNVLAKLAANGPAFFNPLEVYEAKKLRDLVLRVVWNMQPNGEPISATAPTPE